MAARKYDYVLCILCLVPPAFLMNFFEGQARLQFPMVESLGGHFQLARRLLKYSNDCMKR